MRVERDRKQSETLITVWLVALAIALGCAAPLVAGQTQLRGK